MNKDNRKYSIRSVFGGFGSKFHQGDYKAENEPQEKKLRDYWWFGVLVLILGATVANHYGMDPGKLGGFLRNAGSISSKDAN